VGRGLLEARRDTNNYSIEGFPKVAHETHTSRHDLGDCTRQMPTNVYLLHDNYTNAKIYFRLNIPDKNPRRLSRAKSLVEGRVQSRIPRQGRGTKNRQQDNPCRSSLQVLSESEPRLIG